MKKELIGAIAVLSCMTCQAMAQSSGTDWSGAYAGLGFAMADSDIGVAELSTVGATNDSPIQYDDDHLQGFAGYMWDFGTFTLGGEVQFLAADPAGLAGPAGFQPQICSNLLTPCADASVFSTIDPQMRVRALVGYEIGNRTLLLGAVGLASADVTYDGVVVTATSPIPGGGVGGQAVATFPFASESGTVHGLSLGLGLEHQLSDGFSLRFFASHDIYESFNVANPTTASIDTLGNLATATVTDYIDYTTTSIEISAVYRF